MNDLLQLRTDMKERHASVVQSRKALRDLEVVVRSLSEVLHANASRLIRPDNVYWKVLSNAVAGAVEHAKELLKEAADISNHSIVFRVVFFWCLGFGLDADIDEIRYIFECIKKVAEMSESRTQLHEKVKALRRVNTLSTTSKSGSLHRHLSDIMEETISAA